MVDLQTLVFRRLFIKTSKVFCLKSNEGTQHFYLVHYEKFFFNILKYFLNKVNNKSKVI